MYIMSRRHVVCKWKFVLYALCSGYILDDSWSDIERDMYTMCSGYIVKRNGGDVERDV
jgi:nitrite reductase/ring-hydroxylating ferredoxin subunit